MFYLYWHVILYLCTCITSATVYFVRDGYHILIFPFGFGVVHPSFMNRLPSPAIGIMIWIGRSILFYSHFLFIPIASMSGRCHIRLSSPQLHLENSSRLAALVSISFFMSIVALLIFQILSLHHITLISLTASNSFSYAITQSLHGTLII